MSVRACSAPHLPLRSVYRMVTAEVTLLTGPVRGVHSKAIIHHPTGSPPPPSSGVQMLLDSSGQVWAKSATISSGGWTQETPTGEVAISAGDSYQMILDSAGQVWAKNTIW